MNKIIQLRHEIAEERLTDLSNQYGVKSSRVKNYKNRMKEVLVNFNKFGSIDSKFKE